MPAGDALALLDLEGSERFALPEGVELVPAVELPYDVVAACLTDEHRFAVVVAQGVRLTRTQVRQLQAFWRMQQGLVAGDDLSRLLWTLDHFHRELEADLLQRVGVRLGDLWQARQWRLLLNLIDHLPRATWSWQRMANHPEYAERVADAIARQRVRREEPAAGPPLVEYTPEVAAAASVVDAINGLRSTLIAVNLERGKQPPVIPPYPRPQTLVDRMVETKERALRWSAHENLVARLLPGRK